MSQLHPNADKLASHATAIGFVCINWTSLEYVVDVAIAHFLGKPPDDQDAHIIAVNMDMGGKLKVLKALGVKYQPNNQWFSELDRLINDIDNRLRRKRNRVVHDLWRVNPDETGPPLRTYAKCRVIKQQSHQPPILDLVEIVHEEKEDIEKIASEIYIASVNLFLLMGIVPGFNEAIEIND